MTRSGRLFQLDSFERHAERRRRVVAVATEPESQNRRRPFEAVVDCEAAFRVDRRDNVFVEKIALGVLANEANVTRGLCDVEKPHARDPCIGGCQGEQAFQPGSRDEALQPAEPSGPRLNETDA